MAVAVDRSPPKSQDPGEGEDVAILVGLFVVGCGKGSVSLWLGGSHYLCLLSLSVSRLTPCIL